MDLRARLARLDRATRRDADPAPLPAGSRVEVPDELGLTPQETAAGMVWTREMRDPVPELPGILPDLTGLLARDPALRPRAHDLLLLDTETTGLAGGTGTLVFQVGASWWEGAELVTRQYFLPGPAHEDAMLVSLAELAAGFSAVVTYNGASFDLPLLRTRALLNRRPDPLADLVSWDLLVPARRLWSRRLADCRQQSVEEALAGRPRGGGDIEGGRIPQAWFDFLAGGGPGLLPSVLRHNHRDMVGMAGILTEVVRVGTWLSAAEAAGDLPTGWTDRAGAWALGRIREMRREPAPAAACFACAWRTKDTVGGDPDAHRFRRDAIRNLKRLAQWEMVEEIIADGLDCRHDDTDLHREAAILYEHRLADPVKALAHAQRCAEPRRVARLERIIAARYEAQGGAQRENDT